MSEGKAAQVSPFLALPTEIRLKIYYLVFDGVKLFAYFPGYPPQRLKTKPGRDLLYTCRTCYDEGFEPLLSCATWVVGSRWLFLDSHKFAPLNHTMTGSPATNYCSFMQHLEMDHISLMCHDLSMVPNLKTLNVRILRLISLETYSIKSGLTDTLLYDALMDQLMGRRKLLSSGSGSSTGGSSPVKRLFPRVCKYEMSVECTFSWASEHHYHSLVRAEHTEYGKRTIASLLLLDSSSLLLLLTHPLTRCQQDALINLDTGHVSHLAEVSDPERSRACPLLPWSRQ